jgi:hypothetical protein
MSKDASSEPSGRAKTILEVMSNEPHAVGNWLTSINELMDGKDGSWQGKERS